MHSLHYVNRQALKTQVTLIIWMALLKVSYFRNRLLYVQLLALILKIIAQDKNRAFQSV